MGPTSGPKLLDSQSTFRAGSQDPATYKGLAVYIIIGVCSSCRENRSPMVPPATLRNALPERPLRNRAMIIVCMFFANAHGMSHITKKVNETI